MSGKYLGENESVVVFIMYFMPVNS